MSNPQLYVTCPCGQRVDVSPGMAGTEVRCRCGRAVPVPTLRELRRRAPTVPPGARRAANPRRFRRSVGIAGLVLAAVASFAVIAWKAGVFVPRPNLKVSEVPGAAGPAGRTPQSTAEHLADRGSQLAVPRPSATVLPQAQVTDPAMPRLGKFTDPGMPPPEVFGGDPASAENLPQPQDSVATVPDPEGTFRKFCSTCHVLPTPDVEPKSLWPAKIRQMYRYARGARPQPPATVPPMQAAINYWSSRAPDYLKMPEDAFGSPPSPIPFNRRLVSLDVIPSPPAISCVNFVPFRDDGPVQVLLSDMRHGLVVLWTPSNPTQPARVIGRVPHPSRTHVVDLDGDGLLDILVANLGDFWPVDTNKGSVVWLRNRGNEQFEQIVLADGLGRVNDVQAADFDGDGDRDLIVAVFGNLKTGMLLYLENCTKDYAHPDFEPLPLDYRTGWIDVPVVDLNGDGHPDFVTVQGQEHDQVLAFVNRGWGSFREETVYKAPHPRWGSTGIQVVDLNGDGRPDVLYNHGDAFQFPAIPRPYHGVSWLENRGTFPFTYHRLTHLPGAVTSPAADLDGDGRLDVVSTAFIPGFSPAWREAELMDSVVWLRQTVPGEFKRYSLETRLPYHATAALGDLDGDGDIDIVVGNFFMFRYEGVPWDACLTVFENRSLPAGKARGAEPPRGSLEREKTKPR